jgi:Fe-S oxidoreductases
MTTAKPSISEFTPVYGPVSSWRYGKSLGIDPIGEISTCSFNCVYCQLGEIELKTEQRRIYVPTDRILQALTEFSPWDVDVITLSGSGEPTLAENLGEILIAIKTLTQRSTLVLTNGTTLFDPQVRKQLALADRVSIKLDGISPAQLQRVNRPVMEINLTQLLDDIQEFSRIFQGELGLQTMLLSPWSLSERQEYFRWVKAIAPAEIQLNTPTRPKPLKHELAGRGNHSPLENLPYQAIKLKSVSPSVLQDFAQEIQDQTGIPVRYAPVE